jgi:hypothetical protein
MTATKPKRKIFQCNLTESQYKFRHAVGNTYLLAFRPLPHGLEAGAIWPSASVCAQPKGFVPALLGFPVLGYRSGECGHGS